jgi:uncharacterized protein
VTRYFLDSSAVVKRYITETGSGWIQQLTAQSANNQLFLARITWVEVLSALSRRQREGFLDRPTLIQIKTVFQTHVDRQYEILEVDRPLTEAAGDLVTQYPLRAYDAIQLAAALQLKATLNQAELPDPIFLTADQRLLTIAQATGLPTDNPNNYP